MKEKILLSYIERNLKTIKELNDLKNKNKLDKIKKSLKLLLVDRILINNLSNFYNNSQSKLFSKNKIFLINKRKNSQERNSY